MSQEVESKAQAAIAALTELKQAALGEAGSAQDAAAGTRFRLVWEEGMSARDLAEEVLRTAAECVSHGSAFRRGRVYCYACASAGCEHSVPSSPGEVFAGYQSTGRPRWEEFFNFLLASGDTRTDLLFADRPEVLARVSGRRRLTSDQLVSFGRNSLTYRVWGQVTAGYFRVDEVRAALTAQVVETRDHRLHLQLLTPALVEEALANAPPEGRSAFHRVHDALNEARQEVLSLSTRWQMTHQKLVRREVEEKAFAALRHLAHSIERKGRQDQRRTVHAEVRGQQQRPVHRAYEDLAAATQADFFRDAMKGSVIVVGKSGRAHAFSDDGKHITSIVLGRDELDRRQRRRRYLPLAPAQVQSFRAAAAAAPAVTAAPGVDESATANSEL